MANHSTNIPIAPGAAAAAGRRAPDAAVVRRAGNAAPAKKVVRRPSVGPKLGDVRAVVRAMNPDPAGGSTQVSASGDLDRKRRMLAEFFQFIGAKGPAPGALGGAPPANLQPAPRAPAGAAVEGALAAPSDDEAGLSRRTRQTLGRLLAGDSEKEIAARLELSPHTVHVYVKALYRHFAVSSRGELLARFVRRG